MVLFCILRNTSNGAIHICEIENGENYRMDYLTSDEIKTELLNSLREIDMFLKKNNIQYSIMSGTMLGCIRHGGFIPWDDDIDIGMLRPEYNKLLNLLRKNSNCLNEELFGAGIELENGQWPFLKIYNKNILVKENMEEKPVNLWIDVFPFDGMPCRQSNLYQRYIMLLRKIFHYRRDDLTIDKKNRKHFFALKTVNFLTGFISKKNFEKYYIKICSKYDVNTSEWVEDLTWGKKSVPRNLFDNLVDYKFETVCVKGFEDYDKYLKRIYGNYMELPPEENRVNHGVVAWRVKKNEE